MLIDGEDATGFIGQVGYMLQKDLLLPWRTVLDNVALGMEIKGVPMKEARERALPLIQRYGLGGFEHQHPSALSGGMRQRAALLRTLLIDMDVILLDEPFGALDAQTKSKMQEWLLGLFADFGRTVVFVTHDVEEAIFLSDEIHVMATKPGRIIEALPIDLPRPRHRSVVTTPRFMAMKKYCLDLLHAPGSAAERGGVKRPNRFAGDHAFHRERHHEPRFSNEPRCRAARRRPSAPGRTPSPPRAARARGGGCRSRAVADQHDHAGADGHPGRLHRAVGDRRRLQGDRSVLLVATERDLDNAADLLRPG